LHETLGDLQPAIQLVRRAEKLSSAALEPVLKEVLE